jgi:hypothetical protein
VRFFTFQTAPLLTFDRLEKNIFFNVGETKKDSSFSVCVAIICKATREKDQPNILFG